MPTCNYCDFTGGIDYFPGPFDVNFPAGITNVSFRVLIADDEIAEQREAFRLYIHSNSLYYLVKSHHWRDTHVYIEDNDCKLLII